MGARAVELLEARRLRGVTCEADYQLGIEDALACSQADIVVFIDAARGKRRPFVFKAVAPEPSFPPMTHALSPGAVLAVASALYGRTPPAYILAVRGYRWAVGEGLSARAEENLARALAFLEAHLKEAGR